VAAVSVERLETPRPGTVSFFAPCAREQAKAAKIEYDDGEVSWLEKRPDDVDAEPADDTYIAHARDAYAAPTVPPDDEQSREAIRALLRGALTAAQMVRLEALLSAVNWGDGRDTTTTRWL
jgi:hypothetical protein